MDNNSLLVIFFFLVAILMVAYMGFAAGYVKAQIDEIEKKKEDKQ